MTIPEHEYCIAAGYDIHKPSREELDERAFMDYCVKCAQARNDMFMARVKGGKELDRLEKGDV